MAVASRLDQVLEMFLDNYMRSVYSILPCEVVGVNYDIPSVDCKPLVYDVNDEGQTVKIAEINDVPLFVYSGQKGKVKITMPVAVGDRVLFSKYGGTDVKLDGEDYLIMREDDILGVVQA